MVHIQYLKVESSRKKEITVKRDVTLGTIFSDSHYCGHIHDLSDTLYY